MAAVAASAPRIVREADWRFLLPAAAGGRFAHLLLRGGSPDLDATLIELGVARRVSRRLAPGDRVDALVILAGADEPIDEAAAQLAEGGILYWEVDRRRGRHLALTPSRALRSLRRHGLTPTASYWVKPGFPDRHMYLPLDARHIVRWYLGTLFRTTSMPRRVLKTALQALAATRRGLGAVAPCYAVTAVRGAPPRRPALVEEAARGGAPVSERLHPLVLAHGHAEWNRIVMLLFEPGARHPAAAIKVSRRPELNQKIEWEHACLRELASSLDPTLRASIPASTLLRWSDLSASIETCVAGASLHSRAARGNGDAIDDLRRAAEWLGEFHCRTTGDVVPAREWLTRRLLAGQAAEYAAIFGSTDLEQRLFTSIDRSLASVGAGALPLVWQHADFGPWNVFREGDRISVIDWEIARRGPALVDLLYFATRWGIEVTRAGREDDRCRLIDRLFCASAASDPLANAVRAQIAAYMRRLALAPALLPALLVYTFLEQALERVRRLDVEGADASDRGDNPYVGYLGVLARRAEALFA